MARAGARDGRQHIGPNLYGARHARDIVPHDGQLCQGGPQGRPPPAPLSNRCEVLIHTVDPGPGPPTTCRGLCHADPMGSA